MKNLLSENMLRFGTKNLPEAAQRELTLKSIIETIDAHGLRNEVRQSLTEAPDAKVLGPIESLLVGINDGEPITDLFTLGSTYTTNNSFAAYSPAVNRNQIIAIPKGTVWTASADGKLMTAPCKVINVNEIPAQIRTKDGKLLKVMDRLENGEFIARLAAGKIDKIGGGKVLATPSTCGMCLHLSDTVATSNGYTSRLKYPSAYVDQMKQKIQSFRA